MPLSLKESICTRNRLPSDDSVLMGRAELLAPKDRELIEAVLIRQLPTRTVASFMEVKPFTIRQRVHKLVQRLQSRRFLAAARAIPYLPPGDAVLARMKFCQRLSHRQICRQLRITSYLLRRRLDRVTARIEAVALIQRSGSLRKPSDLRGHIEDV